jgi:hypothetical protein
MEVEKMKMKLTLWRDEGYQLRGTLLQEEAPNIWSQVCVELMENSNEMPFGINHFLNPIEVFGLHKLDIVIWEELYHALWKMMSKKGSQPHHVEEIKFDYPGEYTCLAVRDEKKLPINVFISEIGTSLWDKKQ